jgi:hypothetical protein
MAYAWPPVVLSWPALHWPQPCAESVGHTCTGPPQRWRAPSWEPPQGFILDTAHALEDSWASHFPI